MNWKLRNLETGLALYSPSEVRSIIKNLNNKKEIDQAIELFKEVLPLEVHENKRFVARIVLRRIQELIKKGDYD